MTTKTMLTLAELESLSGRPRNALITEIGADALTNLPRHGLGVPPLAVRAVLTQMGYAFPKRTVTHVNLKGGIGKTTCTVTTAARAAQYGFRTCVIDLDPQASATLAFDCTPATEDPLFCDIWEAPIGVLEHALVPVQSHLSLLPSALENGLLETSLADPQSQRVAAKGVCDELNQLGFDLVLVDCPPSLGTATISAICAADIVVIPLTCDSYALNALRLTIDEVRAICRSYDIPVPQLRIIVSRFDRRERAAREILELLLTEYPDELIPQPIRVSTEFNKALARRETLFANYRNSPAKNDYDNYILTLLSLQF